MIQLENGKVEFEDADFLEEIDYDGKHYTSGMKAYLVRYEPPRRCAKCSHIGTYCGEEYHEGDAVNPIIRPSIITGFLVYKGALFGKYDACTDDDKVHCLRLTEMDPPCECPSCSTSRALKAKWFFGENAKENALAYHTELSNTYLVTYTRDENDVLGIKIENKNNN